MASTGAETGGSAEDHAYFLALEEAFLGLRGSGTLLSAADWQVAREWRRAGIPVDLVIRVMSDLFVRQRERAPKRGISSLRYFRAAIAAAWDAQLERAAGGYREPERPEPSVRQRLEAIAAGLPATLPDLERWRLEILALDGTVPVVESALASLEARLLAAAESVLSDAARRELESEVDRASRPLASRLDPAGLAQARESLRRQLIRRRGGLPLLSLFATSTDVEE